MLSSISNGKQYTVRQEEQMEVKAMHIARGIDTVGLFQKLYSDRARVQHILQRDSVVLCLKGQQSDVNEEQKTPKVSAWESQHVHTDKGVDRESVEALENYYTTPLSTWGMDFSKQGPKWPELIAPHAVGGRSGHPSPLVQHHTTAKEEQLEKQERNQINTGALSASREEDYGDEGPTVVDLPSISHKDRFVVYYDYGACVFFNCDDNLVSALQRHLKPFLREVRA
jgi:hypothetical protein